MLISPKEKQKKKKQKINDNGNQNKVILYNTYKLKIIQKLENYYIHCDYSNFSDNKN